MSVRLQQNTCLMSSISVQFFSQPASPFSCNSVSLENKSKEQLYHDALARFDWQVHGDTQRYAVYLTESPRGCREEKLRRLGEGEADLAWQRKRVFCLYAVWYSLDIHIPAGKNRQEQSDEELWTVETPARTSVQAERRVKTLLVFHLSWHHECAVRWLYGVLSSYR